jgi:C4-dicarboxylate-specific signal transduction histidine kinase
MLAKQYDRELENRVIFEMQKNIENTKIMLQQSRLAQIGEMITAIAHQWKEPLSVINQVVQDLPDAYKYGELNEMYMNTGLDKIGFQVDYMEHTIDDFRNFFKTDKKKEHFTFKDVIDPVMTLMGNTLSLVNITVETHTMDNHIAIYSYKNELKQVIINLLNYAKHVFEATSVIHKKVTIGIREDEDNIYLSFRHNAGSVTDEMLQSIFEFDFEHPETNNIEGIGLYLSKKIITQNLGGDIVAGNDNDGMIFVIRLNKEA